MNPRKRVSPEPNDRVRLLLDVGRRLTGTLEPEALYHTIYEQLARVLPADAMAIALFDESGTKLRIVYHAGGFAIGDDDLALAAGDVPCLQTQTTELTNRTTLFGLPTSERNELQPDSAVLSAPMMREDRALGVISTLRRGANEFDAADADLFTALVDLVSIAIANARFVQTTQQRRREAERLEEIGLALTASLDLPKVLERITAAARELTDSDASTVWLVRSQAEVEVAMTAGSAAPPRGIVLPLPLTLEAQAILGKPFVFEDVASADDLPEYLRALSSAASTMAVPLIADDRVLGALSVGQRERRRYTQEDLQLLERLSLFAAIAVANARLHEEILSLSLTDPLTGLPNRRHLEMFLEKEFAAARRGRRLTIVLTDLDSFKDYNDQHGHQAGDEVLRAFGRVLAQQTRSMNLSARYGGDEFITILADADRRGGLTHAVRVARAVVKDPLLAPASVSASAGIASYNPRMAEPADLIRAADRDLYARKARGREIRA